MTDQLRPVQAQELINYSEFWTLAGCEMKWTLGYLRGQEEPGERRGLNLGTLLHLGGDLWNRGEFRGKGVYLPKQWTDDINTGGKPGEERTIKLADFDPDVVNDAMWLLDRYVSTYGIAPPSSWKVVDSERWLMAALDELKLLVGRTDGVLYVENDLYMPDGWWLLERKSYASKGRLDYVHVDPQLVVYKLLVEANYPGVELRGVIYDGIYTYRWKRDQHAPQDSFERKYVDISPEQIEVGKTWLYAAINRRRQLKLDPLQALPNVGMFCKMCGFKDECWARLRGAEEYEIEVDDQEAEPV